MPMVRHATIGKQAHGQPSIGFLDYTLECSVILRLLENPRPSNRTVENVVYVTARGKSQSAWHELNCKQSMKQGQDKDSRPLFPPLHADPTSTEKTFSVHLDKNVCQCFHADWAIQGNAMDLSAVIHRLPLYEAALDLAETFNLRRNKEEEPVNASP